MRPSVQPPAGVERKAALYAGRLRKGKMANRVPPDVVSIRLGCLDIIGTPVSFAAFSHNG
jgi:hypothetical protein